MQGDDMLPHGADLVLLFMAGLVGQVEAPKDAKTGFLPKVHQGAEGERKYFLFVPHDYKGDKEYPVILFLHGAGERGTDGIAPVKQGIANGIKFKGMEAKFPFFVVIPQCKEKRNWQADGPDAQQALAILEETQKNYKIDAKRIYLTGLSMGGFGTWSLAAKYPDKWAAIAPICGGGDPKDATKIKHIPCWCFHGDKDAAVKVEKSREMIEALKAAGSNPRYTEMPFVGHNSWDPAYVTGELYQWFLSQSKK